jgi:hypothetical protein
VLAALPPAYARAQQSSLPRVFLARGELLRESRARVQAKDTALAAAYAHLLDDARLAMTAGPWSVVDKKRLAPSGDAHDYMSFGPYWWPDSTKPNGLPYVRRDGVVNPGSRGDESNSPSFARMSSAATTLALAYYFSGEERYASRATLVLRRWFLDSATGMNPNLRYGQAIPGLTDGRGIGLIDTRELSSVVDAIGLLHGSASWTSDDDRGMQAWASAFLHWMQTSPQGLDEANAANNHGTWYDVQLVSLACFVGDTATAAKTLRERSIGRIDTQILADGRQPAELARTQSLHYSEFNVEAFTRLAELARHAGVDLWGHTSPGGGSIAAALRQLAPYTDTTRAWPGQQLTPSAPADLLAPLRRAERALKDSSLHAALLRIPVADRASHRSRLLHPNVP